MSDSVFIGIMVVVGLVGIAGIVLFIWAFFWSLSKCENGTQTAITLLLWFTVGFFTLFYTFSIKRENEQLRSKEKSEYEKKIEMQIAKLKSQQAIKKERL